MTDLYGIDDLIMKVKESWVEFLECLSFTDLDQDPEENNAQSCMSLITVYLNAYNNMYLRSVCSFGVALGVGGKMSLYLATRHSPY